MEITIPTPREFSFKRTVISHGWCQLLPFAIDQAQWRLTRTLDLRGHYTLPADVQQAASLLPRRDKLAACRTLLRQQLAAMKGYAQ